MLEAIGVMACSKFRETGKAVGDTFDGAEPCRARANRGEEGGEHCSGGFVAPVREKGSEADAEYGAIEPAVRIVPRWLRWRLDLRHLLFRGAVENDSHFFESDQAAFDHLVEVG